MLHTTAGGRPQWPVGTETNTAAGTTSRSTKPQQDDRQISRDRRARWPAKNYLRFPSRSRHHRPSGQQCSNATPTHTLSPYLGTPSTPKNSLLLVCEVANPAHASDDALILNCDLLAAVGLFTACRQACRNKYACQDPNVRFMATMGSHFNPNEEQRTQRKRQSWTALDVWSAPHITRFCLRCDAGLYNLCLHMHPAAQPHTHTLELRTGGCGPGGDGRLQSRHQRFTAHIPERDVAANVHACSPSLNPYFVGSHVPHSVTFCNKEIIGAGVALTFRKPQHGEQWRPPETHPDDAVHPHIMLA